MALSTAEQAALTAAFFFSTYVKLISSTHVRIAPSLPPLTPAHFSITVPCPSNPLSPLSHAQRLH
eukprot:1540341-Prymnesium_polylepis.1